VDLALVVVPPPKTVTIPTTVTKLETVTTSIPITITTTATTTQYITVTNTITETRTSTIIERVTETITLKTIDIATVVPIAIALLIVGIAIGYLLRGKKPNPRPNPNKQIVIHTFNKIKNFLNILAPFKSFSMEL